MRFGKYLIAIIPALAAFSLFISLLGGCAPKKLVSQSQEIEIGQQAAKELESKNRILNDSELNAKVDAIGQLMAKNSERPDLKYTFKIIDSKTVNAVSLPGGWVYIYKGLIDQTADKPDQLAGVIAHEVGHIAARHHADMIGRQTYASILIGALTKDETTQIASIFANVTLLRWSRKHEFEADERGIKYMYKSQQYDPQGLINFFNYLLSQEKDKPSQLQQIFLTHPVTSERIARAQSYYDELRNKPVSQVQ